MDRDKHAEWPAQGRRAGGAPCRLTYCVKWCRGRRTGPIARRVQRGWYVVSILDSEHHMDVEADDDSFNED